MWEKLTTKVSSAETPAFIEQPGGPMAYRLSIYSSLVEISEQLKMCTETIDSSVLAPERIGEQPSNSVSRINPRMASFKDGTALKELHTSLVNRHSELSGRVFSSGFSGESNSLEAYLRAYESSGDSGKTKDISLFYAFVVFSSAETLLEPLENHRRCH
jgi:hypothetical protein